MTKKGEKYMTIYIGADHRGFDLKERLKVWLSEQGNEVVDCGNRVHDLDDDFPDFSFAVADKVSADPGSRGIVICGSGGGVTIAANKVRGVRCTTAVHVADVKHNRYADDINVLALSADYTDFDEAKELLEAFIKIEFDASQRHVRRLNKITERDR
jgi:ribose 5-phosphate isomerase B